MTLVKVLDRLFKLDLSRSKGVNLRKLLEVEERF